MLKINRHITDVSQIVRGSIKVPGGVTKLVGVAVTGIRALGGSTLNLNRETSSVDAYRIRLQINNQEVDTLDYPYNDKYTNVFNNVSENLRLLPCVNVVKPQSTIHYIVNVPTYLGSGSAVKVYLKFE
jgi:hypothetical protein